MTMMKMAGAIAAFALTATATAAQNLAVGVNVGTPGIGVQAQYQVSPMFVVRGAVDGLSFSRDEDYSDINYNGKVKEFTGGLFADLHPGGSSFFVSGGAYFGRRKIELDALPTAPVDIGGQTFTPAQVGRLDGSAKLSDVQPFVGLGFDNTFTTSGSWGFRGLVGVAFSKKPDVNLTASGGLLSNDPTFQARLQQEEDDAQDDADSFRYFPVVQLGVTRKF